MDNIYSSGSVKVEHNDKDTIIRSKQDFPPSTYVFKVESFSLWSKILKQTQKENLESSVFKTGGHKWKLVLYPFGDTKRNAQGYISLYLAMAGKNEIPNGCSLNVRFKFFIYDHIQDNYLVIKNDTVNCFHASKKEHGFQKLLPLRMFEDLSNGFLVDDTGVFGVDVHVLNFSCRGDKIKLISNPPNGTYTWNIRNFSKLEHQECLTSEIFVVAGHKWKIVLYPKGCGSSKGKYISLGLQNDDDHPRPEVYVEFNIMVKDQINGIHEKLEDKDWYNTEWVFFKFLALTYLHDPSKGFLANDNVIVEVEINLISAIEAC